MSLTFVRQLFLHKVADTSTKDPTRVQPHLKKCFEGVAKLNFNPNMEILAMISSEKEQIPFDQIIYPADARGMVEKWLLEVEEAMLSNVRRVTLEGTIDYTAKLLGKWSLFLAHKCIGPLI